MTWLEVPGAFLVAGLVALVVTPLIGRLASRVGAVAQPTDRGLHDHPVPYLGGVAILAAALVAAAVFVPADAEVRAIMGGGVAIVAIGVLDDALELPAPLKLLGQSVAALIPVLAGVRVEDITLPLVGNVEFGGATSVVLTVIGIVAVMNVVNFSDGVDGLAAGVAAIAALTFAIVALSFERYNGAVLAALTAGAALGFLRHNFHPARIFMGDAGSNLLGLLLACVAVQGFLKTTAVIALVLPLVMLAVPILDTGFVVARRIKNRLPFYRADRTHFHHRMASIGFSQRRTVLYLYGWTLTLAALALAIRFVPYREANEVQPGWLAVILAFALVALAASAYVVYILELFQFSRFRALQLRREAAARGAGAPSGEAVEAEIEREIEAGEFDRATPG